jgi:hypothetical protein
VTIPVLVLLTGSCGRLGREGDARRPRRTRGRGDHGHQRQPDDLVHVRARGRWRASPGLYLVEFNMRYDTGFELGLIAFTAAVLGGIGNLHGRRRRRALIG